MDDLGVQTSIPKGGSSRIGETKQSRGLQGICAGSTGMVVLQDPGSSIGKCIYIYIYLFCSQLV